MKVGHSYSHHEDETYVELRSNYVELCIKKDDLMLDQYNDWKYIKNINNNKYHILLKHNEKFYILHTYYTKLTQACSYKPYESLAFISDENGNPLCDPFNDGTVNNTGRNINETHYASFFDLLNIIKYGVIEY